MKLFLVALVPILVGCTPTPQAPSHEDNIAIISIEGDPETLDPRKMRELAAANVARFFYEGLTRVDSQGKIELAGAQAIDLSDDLLTYTVHLRDAQWSDGTPVTAADYVDTWKSLLHPSFLAPNAYQLYAIAGAKEAKEGRAPVDSIGVSVIDPKTIKITLKEPTPYFLELLGCQFFYPVHQKLREGSVGGVPVGNGPFNLVEAKQRQQYVFEKNPHYWDAASVRLDGVTIKVLSETTAMHLFRDGQIHWAGSPLSTIPQDAVRPLRDAKKLSTAPSAATHWFRFNTKKAPFNDVRVRQAFARALDRQSLVENVTQGNQLPALTVVPLFMGLHPTVDLRDNDVAKAKSLLDQAQQSKPLTITLSYIASDRGHKVAQAVQQQWEKTLGVKVNLEASEQKALSEKMKNGEYQVSYGSWYGDITDPVNFLEIFQYASNPTNQTFWEDSQYTALLTAAAKEAVPAKRLALLSQAETILLRELPVAPLMYPTYNYMKDARLQGVYFSPLGYLDFRQAYFQ